MPKIRAYVGPDDNVIAVHEATEVNAFQCPWTKKVFTKRKDYIKHLKSHRINSIYKRIHLARRKAKVKELNGLKSFNEIVEWLEANSNFLYETGMSQAWKDDRAKYPREKFRFKINKLTLTYSDNISCTHHAPRGCKTNWGGDTKDEHGNNVPRSYPGWRGRFEYEMEGLPSFSSHAFMDTAIHFGSGGGGAKSFSSDIYLFLSDWPGLAEDVTFRLLKGLKPEGIIYYGSKEDMYKRS